MEEGRRTCFHGEAKHGGAMTGGSEMRKMLYLGSKGVTTMSTRCRGARQSDVRLIAGSGGAPAANFAGGAAVAKTAREQSSVRRSREAARESEGGSAAGSADEGERVEGEAGRGCRAACVAGAWRPRGERVLTPVGALVRASGRRRRGRPG